MKKIVSAALVASMVAGVAFAVDAKISLNYRTKLDALSTRTSSLKGADDVKTTEWLDWEGYDGAGKQAVASPSDTFKFVLNGDNAGATFAVNLNTNASSYTLSEYSAWMKFALGPGSLKLSSGNWKDGYADGAYRVKKDVDAQNAEGTDFERFKLGSIFKGSKGLSMVDNLGGSNSALSSYAEYTLPVDDSIKLNILLGGVYTKFDKIVDDDTTTYYDSYPVARVQFNMKDTLNAELIYKKIAPKYNTFAAYFMPIMVKNLTLNVGGAFETYSGDADYTDWGFDLRARYQVNDKLSITSFNNISGTDLDAGRSIASGIVGRKGAYGYASATAMVSDYGSISAQASPTFKTAMWNNLSARYEMNETVAFTLNVGLITPLSQTDDDATKYGSEWRVTPAAQIYASKNASIWAGAAFSGVSVESGDYSVFEIDVPVIFRVKM